MIVFLKRMLVRDMAVIIGMDEDGNDVASVCRPHAQIGYELVLDCQARAAVMADYYRPFFVWVNEWTCAEVVA